MPDAALTGLITLAGIVLSGLIGFLASRRKNNADIAAQLTTAAGGLVDRLNQRIDDLEAELTTLRPLVQKVRDLEYQLKCAQEDQTRMQTQLCNAQGRIVVLERENAELRAAGSAA